MSDFIHTEAEEEGITELFDRDTDIDTGSENNSFIDTDNIEEEEAQLSFHNASLQTIDNHTLAELDCLFGQGGQKRRAPDPETPDKPSHPKQNSSYGDEVSKTLSPELGKMQISPAKPSTAPRRQLFCGASQPDDTAEGNVQQDTERPSCSYLPVSENYVPTNSEENSLGNTCADSGFNDTVQTVITQPASPEAETDRCYEEASQEEGPPQGVEVLTYHYLNEETRDLLKTNCEILRQSKDKKVTMLGIFKKYSGFSVMQLLRPFKSDKTQSHDWIVVSPDARIDYWNEFVYRQPEVQTYLYTAVGIHCMYLTFVNSKNRIGVKNFLQKGGMGPGTVTIIEPPNIRIMMNAVYWMKSAHHGKGPMPQWVENFFDSAENACQDDKFDMATMVQWALDHKYQDVDSICYQYSLEASKNNANAKAWLGSTSMYKYACDCAKLARSMTKGRVCFMTMHEFIEFRLNGWDTQGNSLNILKLLHMQGIMYVEFIDALKNLINKVPKKCCMAILGPPNTGKSMFCMSLIKFLDGRVLSFFAHRSHFWLAPLAETKIALIEDCTWPCWTYVDTYLRGALDGTSITIDQKNRDPRQIECPPILMTSNCNFMSGEGYGGDDGKRYPYLESRIKSFCFSKQISTKNRNPKIVVNPEDWADFFIKYKEPLGLRYLEEDQLEAEEEDE